MADETATQVEAPQQPQPSSLSLLAAREFGSNYVGTPKQPEAQPEQPEAEQPEREEAEQEQYDAGEEGVSEEPEVEQEESEQPEVEETDDADEQVVSSLDELIESQQWDREWVDGLKIPVKVDGQESQVPLSEVVKSYQMSQAAEKRLTEAKEAQKQAKEYAAQRSQELNAHFQVAGRLIQAAEQTLDADTKNIDWQTLRTEDPAEYSARKSEIAERREQIEQMKREAVQSIQRATHSQQQESQQEMQQRLQEEQQRMLEAIPEWKEPEKAEQGKRQLVSYLTTQGFEPDDVANTQDHRLIVMARKAMLFDEMQQKTDVTKKRVQKIPKVTKPGAPKSAEQQGSDQRRALKGRLKKSGSLEDAYALLKTSRRK